MVEDFVNVKSAELHLSPLDIIGSHLYITNVFFFENTGLSKDWMPEAILKAGLYDALQHFPALVGRIFHDWRNTMKVVIDRACLNLPSWETSISHAHFDTLKLSRFHRDSWPSEIRINEPNIPGITSEESKLVRVHITRFADNSGVALVLRIAHAIVDAKGWVSFIKHWSNCCRRLKEATSMTTVNPGPIPTVHSFDRNIIYEKLARDTRPRPLPFYLFPFSILLLLIARLLGVVLKTNLKAGKTRSHLFCLPKEKLDSIRHSAVSNPKVATALSNNDILVAIFTMAYARSIIRSPPAIKQQQTTSCKRRSPNVSVIMPCDFRHRLNVPESYTGNCAVGLFVKIPSNYLLQPISKTSVAEVARYSRHTISRVDRHTIEISLRRATRFTQLLGNRVRDLYALMICQAFSNQSRLPFYEVDFGHGRPVFVAPMAYSRTVAVVAPSPPPSTSSFVYLTLEEGQMARLLEDKGFMKFADLIY
ncbi:hypothetical protein E4U55_004328 [Claviceps digitariae]|nr:hypothetical protein E4U55_004328 [Claviceps digitariae]